MLPEGLPERTLGWGVLNWGSKYLAQPDGDHAGDTWKYTNEQARFLLWFYAVDETGRFIFNKGMLSRAKGWGKSPLLAAICCTELCGPVKFSHFDAKGNAVGKVHPSAWVQLAAITVDQTKNTMLLVGEMLSNGLAKEHYSLEVLQTVVRNPRNHGLLETITSSPRSAEGQRPTFVVKDETHLWVPSEKGPEFSQVLDRNTGKVGGRSIDTTNAPVPGQGSVAELVDMKYQQILDAGIDPKDGKLLYDSVEVFVEDIYDKEAVWPKLEENYGDAAKSKGGWVDLDRIWEEINDPGTPEAVARRFYFNQRVRSTSQWLNVKKWEECGDKDVAPLSTTDRIALGFRGRTRTGAVGLVACRLSDSALFVMRSWETRQDIKDDEISYQQVDDFVKGVLDNYNVKFMYAMPQNWQDIVGRWYEANEDVVEVFWTSQKAKWVRAIEQFETAVHTTRLKHIHTPILTRHLFNCHTEVTPQGDTLIRKASQHSPEFIDVAEAAILAFDAARVAIEKGYDQDNEYEVFTF